LLYREIELYIDLHYALEVISTLDPLLGNSGRLKLVWLLARNRNMEYLELMRLSGLSSGNITTHLRKLLQAGYVAQSKTFTNNRPRTTLRLTEKGRKAYGEWGRRILYALPESVRGGLLRVPQGNHPDRLWDADMQDRYSFISLDKGLNLWPPATWSSQ